MRIDIIAVAIQAGMTVFQLEERWNSHIRRII